jgi:hypothetical protein
MTQAFNLAQFANNLNTAGATSNAGLQNSSVTVTAGTGMSGGGSVALGSSVTLTNAGVTSVSAGTGISVSASTGGITITNTAPASGGVTSLNGQTGAITNTSLYAIGSYITGRPQNTTSYNLDNTVAGSNLYAAAMILYWSTDGDYYPNTWLNLNYGSPQDSGVNFVNTGTWRCMSRATSVGAAKNFVGLWVRIS